MSRNMYKKAVEYYQDPIQKSAIQYSQYVGPTFVPHPSTPKSEIQELNENLPHIKWETKHHTSTSDPKVWGPSFWFTLHNGASKYPISASPIAQERMKGFILGIPEMLPCAACKVHATNYIEKNMDNLDEIVSGRESLFKFFNHFHNMVNKRYNKPIVSVEEGHKKYSGGIHVSTMSFAQFELN